MSVFISGNENNHYGYGPDDIHVRYNIINVNTVVGGIRLYSQPSGPDPIDAKIYGNLLGMASIRDLLQIDDDANRAKASFLRELVMYAPDYET